MCASNLQQIGQAMLLYSNDNRGSYPRTSYLPDAMPVFGTGVTASNPFAEDGPKPNDVTAGLFLLLRTQDIAPLTFICPAAEEVPDDYGGKTAKQRSNFTDFKKNLSYSYRNPYPSTESVRNGYYLPNELGAETAVAADKNPGVTGRNDNVFFTTDTSSARDMRMGNSNNHDKDGQNILYGDGHVSWESNPYVSVNRDNIYTTADGKIAASSVDANDSILLPTDD